METVFLALRVLLSLAAVLGLLWMVQRRLTRSGRAKIEENPVTIVARHPVGAKASVVVLDLAGTRFLLGVTEHAVNVLHSDAAPAPAEVTEPENAHSFADVLAETTGDRRNRESQVSQHLRPRRPRPALAGSILSPSTWRQASAVLRQNQ